MILLKTVKVDCNAISGQIYYIDGITTASYTTKVTLHYGMEW